jgi:hypothetical protein
LLTYPEDEIEDHQQCFHAGHCGHSLKSFAHLFLGHNCCQLLEGILWRVQQPATRSLVPHSRLQPCAFTPCTCAILKKQVCCIRFCIMELSFTWHLQQMSVKIFWQEKKSLLYVSLLSFDKSLELRCEFKAEKKLILFDTVDVSRSETVYFLQHHENGGVCVCPLRSELK